jgi:hypothetical protein
MNLTSFLGERMALVLRRLVDAEARVARVEAERNCLAMAVLFATQWAPEAPMGLREGIEEILGTMPEVAKRRPAPAARAGVLREAAEHTRQTCPTSDHVKAAACRPCEGAADRIDSLADRMEADLANTADRTAEQPTPEDVLRDAADRVAALGKARVWSTWAGDYLHPDRTFVDTGALDGESGLLQQPGCSGAAIDHDETGICNHPGTLQR